MQELFRNFPHLSSILLSVVVAINTIEGKKIGGFGQTFPLKKKVGISSNFYPEKCSRRGYNIST